MKIAGYHVRDISKQGATFGDDIRVTREEVEALLKAIDAARPQEEQVVGSLVAKEGYSDGPYHEAGENFVNFHLVSREGSSKGNLRVPEVDEGWYKQPTVDFCLRVESARDLVRFLNKLIDKARLVV